MGGGAVIEGAYQCAHLGGWIRGYGRGCGFVVSADALPVNHRFRPFA